VRGNVSFKWVSGALLFCATHSIAAKPKDPLDIYVVRGDAGQLERFQSEIGKGWRGGKLLDRLSSKTEYRYWAYPRRTAPEARIFMFGSMNFGLRLGFEAYQETTYYPAERAVLDGIVSRCGLKSDPFFIEPDRILLVESQDPKKEVTDCITTELTKAKVGNDMPIKFVTGSPSEHR
jgi:hypothetical protein